MTGGMTIVFAFDMKNTKDRARGSCVCVEYLQVEHRVLAVFELGRQRAELAQQLLLLGSEAVQRCLEAGHELDEARRGEE